VFPLLSGNLVVDSFVLEKPVINLEVDSRGRANWDFASAAPGGKSPPAPDGRQGGGSGIGPAGVALGDVRLVNGTVSYSDARSGATYTVKDIGMSVSLPSLAGPLKADGSLVWNGETLKVKLAVGNPDSLLRGNDTDVTFLVSSDPITLDFKGRAASGRQLRASGAVDIKAPSVRKLAAWAGRPIDAPGDGLGPLEIAGTVAVDGPKYSFTEAKLSLDGIEAKGELRFDASGKRPHLNARLDAGAVDVNPYLPPAKTEEGGAGRPGAGADGTGGKAAARQGWSEEPIDFSGLRAADVDAVLTVASLRVRKIKIGKSQVNVKLNNGRLVTELTEMALYSGNGRATLVADGSAATPAVKVTADFSGIQASPALIDAIEFDRIDGKLDTKLDVTTSGASQRAMISALDGSGNVKFTDGAIRGINIGAMIRNVRGAFLDRDAREQQKTDFSELSGTYTIADGVLRNNDLSLLSPLLRVAGGGTVNMPNQTLDYRIEPRIAATSRGQGGSTDVAGIEVPVIVSGPWSDLSYRPDLVGAIGAGAIGDVVKDPSKALERLRNIAPGSGGSGGGSKDSGDGDSPADRIKKLLGR
jgi:AsmA protein